MLICLLQEYKFFGNCMEEDNAHDIFKWLSGLPSLNQLCISVSFRGETYDAKKSIQQYNNRHDQRYADTCLPKLTLHGNLLACVSVNDAKVPLLFVIENVKFHKSETKDSPFVCILVFCDCNDNLALNFVSEKSREQWMVKIATCSHQMARAQLDEIAYKFYTMTSISKSVEENSSPPFNEFFLANPHRVSHNFAIYQQNNLPSRRVTFEEIMSESKLSIVLPLELVKLYKKWTTEFCGLLESCQHRWPAFVIPTLHDMLREVRENSETLEQCREFLENYSGPPFRKSTEKHRVAFAPVPTNLHVHQYTIDMEITREILSCGTASALPFRFQSGGLSRLSTLVDVDRAYQDFPFWSKRQFIVDLKKHVGQLSHRNFRVDVEWSDGNSNKRASLCSDLSCGIRTVDEFTSYKSYMSLLTTMFEVYNQMNEIIEKIPELDKHVDMLMEEEKQRHFIGRKVDSIIKDSLQNQKDIIDAMLISLSTKVAIIDNIDEEKSKVQIYEKSVRDAMCLCLDMLLALADSILEAQLFGLVMETYKSSMSHLYYHVQIRSDFVLSQTITIAATAILNNVYRGWSVVEENCTGFATDLLLVVTSFLSVYGDEKGMIEDAWEAWRQLESRVVFTLVRSPSAVCSSCVPVVSGQRSAINVASEPSRKNLAIFEWVMTTCEMLGGQAVICCKSGKDRTSMAVTLEQGRVIRETCGLNALQRSCKVKIYGFIRAVNFVRSPTAKPFQRKRWECFLKPSIIWGIGQFCFYVKTSCE
ncbi:hypothetical protein DICVIV_06042 [Dictyocaulus viviparus]|uniref:PH domain-containing protein n=1 Tax=Dictyocaulus viviparus TaxID=29172 RepID=A0A0D8XVK7_DICVI|nr:hypothetical protein DICVIV_06042 [Dictyocaulus viviparus]